MTVHCEDLFAMDGSSACVGGQAKAGGGAGAGQRCATAAHQAGRPGHVDPVSTVGSDISVHACRFSRKPLSQLDPPLLTVLRMAAYELVEAKCECLPANGWRLRGSGCGHSTLPAWVPTSFWVVKCWVPHDEVV